MYDLIIVDDEETIREGLRSFYWEKTGFRVRGTFANGERAIDFLKQHKVDVVITDIRMPVLDGLALTEWIRNNRRSIKVIILSVYKEFEYARRALSSGAYLYLLKPVNLRELEEKMTELAAQLGGQSAAGLREEPQLVPSLSLKRTVTTSAVSKAIDYMNEHYAEPISLQLLASIVELNSCYFSSQFKLVTGWNYQDYLRKLRMTKARHLLETTNLKVYEISDRIGYDNTKYFSDVFKRETGMTPSEFRMSIWND